MAGAEGSVKTSLAKAAWSANGAVTVYVAVEDWLLPKLAKLMAPSRSSVLRFRSLFPPRSISRLLSSWSGAADETVVIRRDLSSVGSCCSDALVGFWTAWVAAALGDDLTCLGGSP